VQLYDIHVKQRVQGFGGYRQDAQYSDLHGQKSIHGHQLAHARTERCMPVHFGLALPNESAVGANDRRTFARTATAVSRVPCESATGGKVRAEADRADVSQLQVRVADVLLHILRACLVTCERHACGMLTFAVLPHPAQRHCTVPSGEAVACARQCASNDESWKASPHPTHAHQIHGSATSCLILTSAGV
jgi:hypothetical protein